MRRLSTTTRNLLKSFWVCRPDAVDVVTTRVEIQTWNTKKWIRINRRIKNGKNVGCLFYSSTQPRIIFFIFFHIDNGRTQKKKLLRDRDDVTHKNNRKKRPNVIIISNTRAAAQHARVTKEKKRKNLNGRRGYFFFFFISLAVVLEMTIKNKTTK